MKASTRKFEIRFNRERNKLERKGLRMFRTMFRDVYKSMIDELLMNAPAQWANMAEKVDGKRIQRTMEQFYIMFAPIALLAKKHIADEKADEDDMFISMFERKLMEFLSTEGGVKITSIINTTKKDFKKVITGLLTEAESEGFGIEKLKRRIVKDLGDNLRGNAYARARAIAQTEMIGASNYAATVAADSSGYETRKFWSTSGLEGVRESHIEAEQYSDNLNGLKKGETFPNGLLYPGDSSGMPEEIINCRCSILHERV